MTINIQKMKQAALAATQGEWKCHWKLQWSIRITDIPGMKYIVGGRENKQLTEQDATFIATANPSAVLELITRLEAAEQDAAIGNWLCNYMASEQVDLDDYLIEACHYDDPAKFKAAILAAMKESK